MRAQIQPKTNASTHPIIAQKVSSIIISPPKFEQASIEIRGTAPYVQQRFSQKSFLKIEATQLAGSQAKSRKIREPRKPQEDYLASMYLSREGWNGIPAPAFRNGAISACKLVGFHMTRAKCTIFVLPDGFDKDDGTPLVRIYGKPRMHGAPATNDNGGTDIRYRAMWEEWTAKPRVEWDTGQFSATDVVNLFMRVGRQVGIGEGRADSKNSAGLGWGHFEVIG